MVFKKNTKLVHGIIRFLMILLGGQVLLILAYHNGYPLNMGDSGGYVLRGFTREINHHWAQFYSLFIRGASFDWSLWGVILVQNYLVAYLLFRVLEQCIRRTKLLYIGYLVMMIGLTFGSSLSFMTNLLMPDIFTACGILAMIVMFLKEKIDVEFLFLWLVIGICQVSHKSSGPIFAVGFFSYFLLMTALLFWKKKHMLTSLYFQKIAAVVAIVFLAPIIVKPINKAYFTEVNSRANVVEGAETSDSKYHFIFAKLHENKMLDQFLEEYCPEKKYTYLCDSTKLAAFLKNGIGDDLHGNDQALFLEVEDVGRTALYDMKYMSKVLQNGVIRIWKMYELRGGIPLLNSIFNENQIPRFYNYLPDDVHRLLSCRIYDHILISNPNLHLIRSAYSKIILISTLVFVFFLFWFYRLKAFTNVHLALIALFVFIFSHYAMMATFSGFRNMRYSARITWLIVFGVWLGGLYLMDRWMDKKDAALQDGSDIKMADAVKTSSSK